LCRCSPDDLDGDTAVPPLPIAPCHVMLHWQRRQHQHQLVLFFGAMLCDAPALQPRHICCCRGCNALPKHPSQRAAIRTATSWISRCSSPGLEGQKGGLTSCPLLKQATTWQLFQQAMHTFEPTLARLTGSTIMNCACQRSTSRSAIRSTALGQTPDRAQSCESRPPRETRNTLGENIHPVLCGSCMPARFNHSLHAHPLIHSWPLHPC
jgi:hypothetical protein